MRHVPLHRYSLVFAEVSKLLQYLRHVTYRFSQSKPFFKFYSGKRNGRREALLFSCLIAVFIPEVKARDCVCCRNYPSCGVVDHCATSTNGVIFTVEGVVPDKCEPPFTKKINVGFQDTVPQSTDVLNLKSLEFSLAIKVAGNVEFDTINALSGWPSVCQPNNACTSSCYESSKSGDVITFSYCLILPPGQTLSLSLAPTAFLELVFKEFGCIESVTVTSLSFRQVGETESCVPAYSEGPYDGIPICPPQIGGFIKTELGSGVEAVDVVLTITEGAQPGGCDTIACPPEHYDNGAGTDTLGVYGFCPCATCRYFDLTPERDDNPLNGVTTYDLVLIQKHILGLEILDSPYKMIAADANKSGSITTFDVVELRKLILGINDTISNNRSWRFVLNSYVFPNPMNPFQEIFPEDSTEIDMITNPSNEIDFVAVKVGDVNYSAITQQRIEYRNTYLSWPERRIKAGETWVVPIVYSGTDTLEALQMGLRYDPTALQLLSPTLGETPAWNSDAFNHSVPGELRTLWLSPVPGDPEWLLPPGQIMYYLTFKALKTIPEAGKALWLDDNLLENLAWPANGEALRLQKNAGQTMPRSSSRMPSISVICQPNPGKDELNFSIEADKAGKGRIDLYSAFGSPLIWQEANFRAGKQQINLSGVSQLAPGIYLWKVICPEGQIQGHWIKE